MQLDELYRRVIMDHYKNPRNRGTLDEDSVTVNLNNPTCGDRIYAAAAGGRRRRQAGEIYGRRLLDQHVLGLDDDGRDQRQDAGRSARAWPTNSRR